MPATVAHFDLVNSTKQFVKNQNQRKGIVNMLKHNEICKQFINKSGGTVIKDIGDAVFASFTSPQTVIQYHVVSKLALVQLQLQILY